MATRVLPYTATMARVYAEQGYLRKAAEIYRQLLVEDPGRGDCREALAELERRLAGQRAPGRKDIEFLLREWKTLLKTRQEMSRHP